MTIMRESEAELQGVMMAAQLMAVAARTAPKTRGLDSVQTAIVSGEDLERLAKALDRKLTEKPTPMKGYARDAANVRSSAAVLLIGVTGEAKRPEAPLSCGACGYAGCPEFMAADKHEGEDYLGPLCVFQSIDLGIAIGSAVKMASELNIDNRIMYTVGAAAREDGMMKADVVIGIPLSAKGKNVYFDR